MKNYTTQWAGTGTELDPYRPRGAELATRWRSLGGYFPDTCRFAADFPADKLADAALRGVRETKESNGNLN